MLVVQTEGLHRQMKINSQLFPHQVFCFDFPKSMQLDSQLHSLSLLWFIRFKKFLVFGERQEKKDGKYGSRKRQGAQ